MKKKKDDFVHLHVHSDMSQLDGCGTIKSYTKAAAKRGNPAIAFTDHGTMRGYHSCHEECEKREIKSIYGIEFYISNDMHRKGLSDLEKKEIAGGLKANERRKVINEYEQLHGIRDRWHLTVWAKNNKGLENLFRLSSRSYIEGFYYKPRIDISTLIEHGDGLMVGTGCMNSIIYDQVISGKKKKAEREFKRLYEKFGDDLWLEIQPHALEGQKVANNFALKLKNKYGLKLLATQDAHYVRHKDYIHHDVLLCIGTRSYVDDVNRFRFNGDEFFLKTRQQMKVSFEKSHGYMKSSQIREALDSTIVLSEKVDTKVDIDYHAALLPHVEIPKGYEDEYDYLKSLCYRGWAWREMELRIKKVAKLKQRNRSDLLLEYKKRLLHELRSIKKQKMISYFLIVYDICRFAREQRIMVGPGRGSAAGSLVSFLLGITSVDPIEHDLLFERFMNPDRIDTADIDLDFEKERRQEILDYLREKYGHDRVAQIATIGTLAGKQCLKDVSRALGVPFNEANAVTDHILERASGDKRAHKTVIDSFKEFEPCKQFNKKYPKVLPHAAHLEGMAKSLGVHAAGCVVAPDTLASITPLEIRKYKGQDLVVTALDMRGVAAIGLVKLDILGLKTLTILRECLNQIEENYGRVIDLEKLDLWGDEEVLGCFTARDFSGIFQFDTPASYKLCDGINFESFADIPALNALNRPGPSRSGLTKNYVERKMEGLKGKSRFHDKIEKITSDTLGVMTYQEHVNRIFIEVAGFKPGKADTVRRDIAKSKGEEVINKVRDDFIEGAMKTTPDMTRKQATRIMNAIKFFGGYSFNKSHATAYGIIAYWGMYLKAHYPVEFYWALLKNEEKEERVKQYTKDARRRGIEITPPDVSISRETFTINRKKENVISGGLLDIKGVGIKAVETIIEHQPFDSFTDLLKKVDRRRCHKGVVYALLQSGALDNLVPNRKWLMEKYEKIWKIIDKHEKVEHLLRVSKKAEGFTEEEAQLVASEVNPVAFGKHPLDLYKKFIDEFVKVPLVSFAEEDFFKKRNNKAVYFLGVVIGVKTNQVGDFHSGELPNKRERKKMNWGARYANVNIEDADGNKQRVKFDFDVYDDMSSVFEKDGSPILVHAVVNGQFQTLRADFVINLEKIREGKEELNKWEKIINGQHPALKHKWKNEEIKNERIKNTKFKKSPKGGTFCGVITHIKIKYDKNDSEMAFVGILGVDTHIEVVCFSSSWVEDKYKFEVGSLIEIAVEKQRQKGRGLSYIYNGGGVRQPKNSSRRQKNSRNNW